MSDLTTRVLSRYIVARPRSQYFEVGDRVYFGKYKNKVGIVKSFGKDKWGNPTVEVEPIPKGRKQNKVFGLFKIWRADVKEKALAEQEAEKAKALTARVLDRYATLSELPRSREEIKGLDPADTDNDFGWQYTMGELDAGPLPHLAARVARRFLAGVVNTMNGDYFSLSWTKAKWILEEMADGSPLPRMVEWGQQNPNVAIYEMPIQEKGVANISHQHIFRLNADTIRSLASLKMGDTGPVARHKLKESYSTHLKELLEAVEEGVKEGHYTPDVLANLKRVIPDILGKAKWKKVR